MIARAPHARVRPWRSRGLRTWAGGRRRGEETGRIAGWLWVVVCVMGAVGLCVVLVKLTEARARKRGCSSVGAMLVGLALSPFAFFLSPTFFWITTE
jgi:hypothetical protein